MSDDTDAASPTRSSADSLGSRSLVPEPRLVERVIHGQRVWVKVYPPASDPSWSEWIRSKLRAPVEPPRFGEHPGD
jgi:hypothetical protein